MARVVTATDLAAAGAAVRAIPPARFAGAIVLVLASLALLSLVDLFAVRAVRGAGGHTVRVAPSVGVSLLAHSIGNGVGFAMLSGGAVRHRMYTSWGMTARETAAVVALSSAAIWLGAATALGITLTFFRGTIPGLPGWIARAAPAAGCAALALVATAFLAVRSRGTAVRPGSRFAFPLPSGAAAAVQVAAAALDWAVAAAILWLLLPMGSMSFGAFVAMFVAAQTVAVASHAPAGAGVFDALILAALAPAQGAPAVIGGLVAYRVIYYLAPAGSAGAVFAAIEMARRLTRIGSTAQRIRPVVARLLWPATFAGGAVLLASTATPPDTSRMALLHAIAPASLIELAYIVSALTGAALLLVARGVQQRLAEAWIAASVLLPVGIAASLLKGLDYEEAAWLAALLLALLLVRPEFQRRASLIAERFTRGWTIATAATLAGSVWLSFFLAGHVRLADGVPFHFHTSTSASRAMLATALAGAACALLGVFRLLRPVQPRPAAPDESARERARCVIAGAPGTTGHLALVGDKALMFSAAGDAFLMYGIAGRSWIAMGDPVGPPAQRAELIREFRTAAIAHGGRPVFYHVTPDNLALYIEMGLTIRKIGESARVPLREFTTGGGHRKWLRKARRQVSESGCTFRVAPREEVSGLMGELRRVSDAWLAAKRGGEKGFSLGYFDEAYIAQCPAAVVERAGRVVAFANVWAGGGTHELSVDLMRYDPSAPPGVIDFLFCELMLWGRDRGFEWFDLGAAPLSGLDAMRVRHLWNRLGALLYRRGERWYNFAGVRRYKEKFDPVWSPRYIAAPGALSLAAVAADVAAIIATPAARRHRHSRGTRHAPSPLISPKVTGGEIARGAARYATG